MEYIIIILSSDSSVQSVSHIHYLLLIRKSCLILWSESFNSLSDLLNLLSDDLLNIISSIAWCGMASALSGNLVGVCLDGIIWTCEINLALLCLHCATAWALLLESSKSRWEYWSTSTLSTAHSDINTFGRSATIKLNLFEEVVDWSTLFSLSCK